MKYIILTLFICFSSCCEKNKSKKIEPIYLYNSDGSILYIECDSI